ncbi:MAG: hypothetical protein FWC41_05875 [Firmicutes bacterium]|nr:hypothetical protein [Bacillota bacterium]
MDNFNETKNKIIEKWSIIIPKNNAHFKNYIDFIFKSSNDEFITEIESFEHSNKELFKESLFVLVLMRELFLNEINKPNQIKSMFSSYLEILKIFPDNKIAYNLIDFANGIITIEYLEQKEWFFENTWSNFRKNIISIAKCHKQNSKN